MMKLMSYIKKNAYWLFYVSFILFINVMSALPSFAQDSLVLNLEVARVGLQQQTAICKNGLVIDFSNAANMRPIEVGDLINALGVKGQTAINATLTRVRKKRDVQLISKIQNVGVGEITFLNQRILVTKETRLTDIEKLQIGMPAIVIAENMPQGLKAVEIISIPDFGDSILTLINKIEGTKVTLEGGFTLLLKDTDIEFLQLTNHFKSNSPLFVSLAALPEARIKNLLYSSVTPASEPPTLIGTIDSVDPINKTITILGQKIKLAPFAAAIDLSGNLVNLEDIDLSQPKEAAVMLGDSPFANNYSVDLSITFQILIFQ